MRSFLPTLIVLMLAAGCARMPPEPKTTRALPEPATFRIAATLKVNFTPQLMAHHGLPDTIEGALEADARSEAISAEPLRSRHEGRMNLILTAGEGKQPLAQYEMTVSGESDGSPTQGLGQAIRRFLDAASMMTRPLPQPAPLPAESPETAQD